jgi:hypothetical protein
MKIAQQLLTTWLIGVGIGIGLLVIFYGMSLPANPFIYVGF